MNHSRIYRLSRSLAFAGLLALPTACSSGGGGSSGSASSSFQLDVLVEDAPADELLAFRATIDELRLVDSNAGVTDDLLGADLPIEWLGLRTSAAWVLRQTPPKATYTAVRVVLLPGSIEARDPSGTTVAVTAVATTFDALLATPIVVDDSGYSRVVVDLDLAASLTGSVDTPPLTFDPTGSARIGETGEDEGIDEVKGLVSSSDDVGYTLTLDAYVDDDLSVELGEIEVNVSDTTVLVRDDDAVFSTRDAFFAALIDGSTVLEVHGQLGSDSSVDATRIEVEDHNGGVNSAGVVKIEGRVVDHESGVGFELALIEIEKGASIAQPVLDGLGDPGSISVAYDVSTVFVDDSHQLVSSSALAVGQKVDVKFATFVSSPFQAVWVEIDEAADHSATVQDVAGLPNSVVVRLRSSEAAIAAGLVESSSTDVTVDLTSASVFLDVEDDPSFDPAGLLPGLRVDVRGQVEGTPTEPTISASRLRVRPGRFRGTVTATTPSSSSFTAGTDEIDDPFGDTAVSPPFLVLIDESCVFDDEADDETSFFALFTNLRPGEVLEIEVEGVGTGETGVIRAYEIEAEVQ